MTSEEFSKFIGKAGDITILEIEKGAIKRFADSVEDYNPLYWDEEQAGKSRYGSIIAPPGFFGWPAKRGGSLLPKVSMEVGAAAAQAGYPRLIDGGMEYDFFQPIRAGDVLASLDRIADVVVREGKSGKMILVTRETSYTNQNGALVAKTRQTLIYR